MTDIRELRQVLDAQAELAPDGTGVIEAARAGAVRFRRRRRVRYAAGAAVVAAVLAVVPAAVARIGGTGPPPAAPAARPPFQLTLDLAPESGYRKLSYGVVGVVQYLVARASNGDMTNFGAGVALYDPGTFDASALLRGEKITVRGHPAYYVPDFLVGKDIKLPGEDSKGTPSSTPGPSDGSRRLVRPGDLEMVDVRMPVIGWQEPSGAWVVVYQGRDKVGLARVAESVRVGDARPLKAPFRLGHVPAGLPGTVGRVSDSNPAMSSFGVGFGATGTPTLLDLVAPSFADNPPLTIGVLPRTDRDRRVGHLVHHHAGQGLGHPAGWCRPGHERQALPGQHRRARPEPDPVRRAEPPGDGHHVRGLQEPGDLDAAAALSRHRSRRATV